MTAQSEENCTFTPLSWYIYTRLVVLIMTLNTLPVMVVLLLPLLRLHVPVSLPRLTSKPLDLCLQDKLFPDTLRKISLNVWENN